MKKKAIFLAGGLAKRLRPSKTSKQLLLIGTMPMIYYPLATAMLAGIRQFLLISTPSDLPEYKDLLGDGHQWGVEIEYRVQPSPGGLAQAFILGESFINEKPVWLFLGDNVFYGHGLPEILEHADRYVGVKGGGMIFSHRVKDPQRFGVVECDATGRIISIEEKPAEPKSNNAIVGMYCFDGQVAEIAKTLKPSPRGELEITGVMEVYRKLGKLELTHLGRGIAWLDTGTPRSLNAASSFVMTIEEQQRLKPCCPEEIAFGQSWIDIDQLLRLAEMYEAGNEYGEYLKEVASRS